MASLHPLQKQLRERADQERAEQVARFFKTKKGEYGAGDRFLGIRVPDIRKLVRIGKDCGVTEVLSILRSGFHEERLLAVLLLVQLYSRGDAELQAGVYSAYLAHTRCINNWDLVDVSAPKIVGAHLKNRSRKPLFVLAKSPDLWERRIAILATFDFIRSGDFHDTMRLSRLLLHDQHDLIHKAVGWMLREVGKRDRQCAEAFLEQHYTVMPRTMLRYAIEKFPAQRRKAYLLGRV